MKRTSIPKLPTISLNPYTYACCLCGRSGYERVYLGPRKEITACQRCLEAALSLFTAKP